MANQDSQDPLQRNFSQNTSSGAGDDQFTTDCDWGENWGRIAMTSKSSGAEILIVIPFSADKETPAAEIERRIYDQARPQLSKAVRALIGKAWPQES